VRENVTIAQSLPAHAHSSCRTSDSSTPWIRHWRTLRCRLMGAFGECCLSYERAFAYSWNVCLFCSVLYGLLAAAASAS